MRALRVFEGQQVVFDASQEVLKKQRNKFLLVMRGQNASYITDSGVRFRKDHPYQWVIKEEADLLLGSVDPEFREATIEQAQDYYTL